MNRYNVMTGQIDQFNRVINFTVWDNVAGPLAICANEADAKKVAAALNELEPEGVEPPPPPTDPEEGLCPRGGDHVSGDDFHCKKCGEDLIPF